MTNNEILESINDIDSVVLESEMNVIESLIDSYSKSAMILENYEGDNLDSFEIFSESFIMEADDNTSTEPKESRFRKLTKDGKKENILKSILMLIPRLLKWLAQSIQKVWNNRPAARLKREVADLKSRLSESESDLLIEIDKVSDRFNGDISKMRLGIFNNKNDINMLYNSTLKADRNIVDIKSDVDSLKKSQDMMSEDIHSIHNTQDEQSREVWDLDDKIRKNKNSIDHLHDYTFKNVPDMSKRLTQVEQATSAYILAKENKISNYINFEKSFKICKAYAKFIDQITSATMFKPGSVDNAIDTSAFVDLRLHINKSDPNRIDEGKNLYPFDEYVKNCELLQNMCTGLADKCVKAVPIVEKRLKDFNESIEAKGKEIDNNHQMKLDAANKQIAEIKSAIQDCNKYTHKMAELIDRSSKYIEMYKNLYSMFATGRAPSQNSLRLNTNSEYDEVKAPFNKKN